MDKQELTRILEHIISLAPSGLTIDKDGICMPDGSIFSAQEYVEMYMLVELFPGKYLIGEYLRQRKGNFTNS